MRRKARILGAVAAMLLDPFFVIVIVAILGFPC